MHIQKSYECEQHLEYGKFSKQNYFQNTIKLNFRSYFFEMNSPLHFPIHSPNFILDKEDNIQLYTEPGKFLVYELRLKYLTSYISDAIL